MVIKQNNTDKPKEKTGRVNLGKLKLNKETVKYLNSSEAKQIKGGAMRLPRGADSSTDPGDGCERK